MTNRPTTTERQLAAHLRHLDATADSDRRTIDAETARWGKASTTRRQIAALNGEPEIDEKKDERDARRLRMKVRRLRKRLTDLGEDPDDE